MMTQYLYALGSMIPCPIWLWFRWPSAIFLFCLFTWSVYNGSTYYIDVFGKRFQKELEQMKRDVAKWQPSSDALSSPPTAPKAASEDGTTPHQAGVKEGESRNHKRDGSIDQIPLLDSTVHKASGASEPDNTGLRERKI